MHSAANSCPNWAGVQPVDAFIPRGERIACEDSYHMTIYAAHYNMFVCIVQELCESRGGHPGLSVLTSLVVSVDVKIY